MYRLTALALYPFAALVAAGVLLLCAYVLAWH